MKTSMFFAIAMATAAIAISQAAIAQQAGQERIKQAMAQLDERFAKADANGDGKVTKEEAKGKMPRVYDNFEKIDTASAGYVTKEQLVAYMRSQAQQMQGKAP
jgi:Ca2+-binding EF-hand superfamily protein